jgi:hypothetical protein
MNRFFYTKLAVNNLVKNAQTYIPYLLTSIGTIMTFYNMRFLVAAKDIGNLSDSASLRSVLALGAGVIAVFSVIFLFYTNSFLIKRRKKEFGLFNILGMEKKHIARIMFWETLLVAVISLCVGLAAGILFSKLMILLLFKIISFRVTFGFEIPISAVIYTTVLFGGIFILNLIYNISQVVRSKPIELLQGGNVGEKEPKTNWLLASIGAVSLGIAYYIALTTESPLAALQLFFVAVVLAMIGTHCLFTAGSIALLKMLRKNKSYYYQSKHFIPVSGMIYRMKQNATGLANICILSTAVIIMLSTTVSMYVGMEDVLRTRYPRNIIVSASNVSGELSYHYAFDVDDERDAQISLVSTLQKAVHQLNVDGYVEGAESSRESFYSLYGGLFFIGIFLGLLFIMATVLIIYYKQIAEGYDDRERFEIMQKVGMSRAEVKQAIQSQVLTVFFLPLVTAVIHIAFAFKVITKLLEVLNLTNVQLYAGCTVVTILVFAVFYIIVYAVTARTYYNIVS